MEDKSKEISLDEIIAQIKEFGFKAHPLRLEYEEQVRGLRNMAEELLLSGVGMKNVAKTVYEKRREFGKRYKEAVPSPIRQYIYYATFKRYGDPLGPTFEKLLETKSYDQIIESSCRPIEDLDNRLNVEGFLMWLGKSESKI